MQPYNKAAAIVASDTVDFPDGPCEAIFVGVGGVVVVVFQSGAVVNFTVATGDILPVKARRVNATTTTATTMVALYRV